jgi:hypothetical protein
MLANFKSKSRTHTPLIMRRTKSPQPCQAQRPPQRMIRWIFRGKLVTSPSIVCLKTRNFSGFLFTLVAVYYFKCAGLPLLAMFLTCNIMYGATLAMTPYILEAWSEFGGLHMWFYTGMYALSSLLAFAAKGFVTW